MSDPADRREHIRTQLLLKVEYQEPNDLLADYLTDVGEGGLFIRTQVPFTIGQKISFVVSFPGLVDPLQLQGIVRWKLDTNAERADDPCGVGVEFVFADEARRQEVAALVKSFREPTVSCVRAAQPLRVLLVEDNQFVHDLFKHAIRRFHAEMEGRGTLEIVAAGDGQEALLRLGESPIDLAIVDHFLPVMNGSELVERMRGGATKDIPILMVSVGGEGVREAALRAGADLYLDKPVLLKQLLATLKLLVAKRKTA